MKIHTFAQRCIVRSVRNISTSITSGMKERYNSIEFFPRLTLEQRIG